MKTPKFKPSKRFLDRYEVPCLVAKITNSAVGLAKQYVSKYKKELPFEIYLRGREPQTISPWQQQQLELLFKDGGLNAALVEGLKKSCYGDDVDEEDRKFYETNGYSPYFCVRKLVSDDIKQKVIFLVDDEFHVLHEHLGVIYLKGQRWCYEEYDYYLRYAGVFEKFSLEAKAEELKRKQWQEKFDELFPPPAPKTPKEKDCSLIIGRWESDNTETEKLCKELGDSFYARSDSYVFSESYVESSPLSSGRIVEMRRQGNWITVKRKTEIPGAAGVFQNLESKFWCDGKRLVTESGIIYQRTTESPRARYVLQTELRLPGSERATALALDEFHPRLIVSRESALDIVDRFYQVNMPGIMSGIFGSIRVRPQVVQTPNVRRLAMIPAEFFRVCWFAEGASEFGVMRHTSGEFRTVNTPKTGKSPVDARFQRATSELYVFNAGDPSVTVYQIANNWELVDEGKKMQTIPLPAKPVAATCDAQTGLLYCSLEDRNEIAVIDAKTHKVTAVWPVKPGENPSGLAMDSQFQRLFINCANGKLLMLDGKNGKVIAIVSAGEGNGSCAFDSEARLVVSIAGDGQLTIARVESPDILTVEQSLKTQGAGYALAHYSQQGKLFLIKDGLKSGATLLVYSCEKQPS